MFIEVALSRLKIVVFCADDLLWLS